MAHDDVFVAQIHVLGELLYSAGSWALSRSVWWHWNMPGGWAGVSALYRVSFSCSSLAQIPDGTSVLHGQLLQRRGAGVFGYVAAVGERAAVRCPGHSGCPRRSPRHWNTTDTCPPGMSWPTDARFALV